MTLKSLSIYLCNELEEQKGREEEDTFTQRQEQLRQSDMQKLTPSSPTTR